MISNDKHDMPDILQRRMKNTLLPGRYVIIFTDLGTLEHIYKDACFLAGQDAKCTSFQRGFRSLTVDEITIIFILISEMEQLAGVAEITAYQVFGVPKVWDIVNAVQEMETRCREYSLRSAEKDQNPWMTSPARQALAGYRLESKEINLTGGKRNESV